MGERTTPVQEQQVGLHTIYIHLVVTSAVSIPQPHYYTTGPMMQVSAMWTVLRARAQQVATHALWTVLRARAHTLVESSVIAL